MRPSPIRLACLAKLALLLGLVAVGPSQPAAPSTPIPGRVLRPLEAVARDLAKRGVEPEVEETLAILRDAGYGAAALERLSAQCAKAAKRAKKRPPSRGELRRLRDAVRSLTRFLDKPGPNRTLVATTCLRLDDSVATAHEALGHVRVRGQWQPAERVGVLKRRDAIRATLQRARKLDVPLTCAPSGNVLLKQIGRDDGFHLRSGKFSAHGTLTQHKFERLVRSTFQAFAVSAWLREGELVLPAGATSEVFVILESKRAYLDALAKLTETGWMTRAQAQTVAEHASCTVRGHRLTYLTTHVHRAAFLLYMLCDEWESARYGGTVQPCLMVGHLNWLCLAFLGGQFATLLSNPTTSTKPTRYAGEEAAEREEAHRMAGAGIVGSRSWMHYLASRREDPPWSHSFVPQIGDIEGENLLKSTFVVEFLHETEGFVALARKSTVAPGSRPEQFRKRAEDALGDSSAAFEERWRTWLLHETRNGLLQRLTADPAKPTFAPDAVRALAVLNGLRSRKWDEAQYGGYLPVSLDASLSRGALAHARYLHRHPDQAAKWPDAHEEYSDREGFTPEGSWAGLHSVIAPGVESPEHAIRAWMGTFYHRLPLLVPGLVRIGWGFDHGVAVLDSGSISNPARFEGHVAWPSDGANDVPVAFTPELPNPIPGEDQSAWGYPITLQYFGDARRVTMTLHRGRSAGPLVPCHFLTPYAPRNVELAPNNAFCLLPEEHLASATWYCVVATPEQGESIKRLEWTFKTR